MGYGNGQENSLPTTFFKIIGQKAGSTEIYFQGRTKVGDKYEEIAEKPNTIYGHLTGVSVKEYEWEGEKKKSVRLVLDDANERIILEGGFSNLMINVLNTIAGNAAPVDKLRLNVYIDKNGYPSIGIAIDDQEWKDNNWKWDYNKKLKPLIEQVKNKAGKVTSVDKTELIDFLHKEVEGKKFQDNVAGNPPAKTAPATETHPLPRAGEVSVGEEDLDDDLPF
jgi:hypothetical protein